jgi:glycosyltransferase involved in cell wall biosynthesis
MLPVTGWICCQRGAREHYAVPRALHRRGALELLLVDCWCPPGSLLARFSSPLRARYQPELARASVRSDNGRTLAAELRQRIFPSHPYRHQYDLNRKFQNSCVRAMERLPKNFYPGGVFAFSYAAKEILAHAKSRGWKTILGQFDPGPRETEIVVEEYRRHGWPSGELYEPPAGYWEDWRQETEWADRIIVNSSWSARCLVEAGVSASKIRVIPCAYEAGENHQNRRNYPDTFSVARPLEVLFLGQVVARKGIHFLLQAAERLKDAPIRFTIVGGGQEFFLKSDARNVRWVGPVSRDGSMDFYRRADVFVLPTLSDGFGLTQLEAMSWKLPVISTEHCGDIVRDGIDGIILREVGAEPLVEALRRLLTEPGLVKKLSAGTSISSRFSLDSIGQQLLDSVRDST